MIIKDILEGSGFAVVENVKLPSEFNCCYILNNMNISESDDLIRFCLSKNGKKIIDWTPIRFINEFLKEHKFDEDHSISLRYDVPKNSLKISEHKMFTKNILKIMNQGDLDIHPKVYIKCKKENSLIEVKNITNGTKIKVENMFLDEMVLFDGETNSIETDLSKIGFYETPYDRFESNFLKLSVGLNEISVKGVFELVFEYELKYLF